MFRTSFFRVKDEIDHQAILRGLISLYPDKFTVIVLKNGSAFEGEISNDVISEHCQSLSLSSTDYLQECELAFKNDQAVNYFSFSVENENFRIKKRCETESGANFKVIFCAIPLKIIDYSEAVVRLLDNAINSSIDYVKKFAELSRDKESLLLDNVEKVKLLEEMAEEKSSFERVVYHKVANLLNSKKEFYAKHQTSKTEEIGVESDEFTPTPSSTSIVPRAIYDAETDDDENMDSVISVTESSVSKNSEAFSSSSNATGSQVEPLSQPTTDLNKYLKTLDFLDPSVPYLNK